MKLQIVLEPSEEGGYAAIVPALPGCLSEGETWEEALANVREAIALYLEPIEEALEDRADLKGAGGIARGPRKGDDLSGRSQGPARQDRHRAPRRACVVG